MLTGRKEHKNVRKTTPYWPGTAGVPGVVGLRREGKANLCFVVHAIGATLLLFPGKRQGLESSQMDLVTNQGRR